MNESSTGSKCSELILRGQTKLKEEFWWDSAVYFIAKSAFAWKSYKIQVGMTILELQN